ncbi:MAG: alpha/beta hydrolase [Bdellovibrionales bacterium]
MNTIHRLEPDGKPDSLVIMLHGYGADGQDLIDLGHSWRSTLPHTVFVAPDAPSACEMGGPGFQWWSIADGLDPSFNLPRADACRRGIEKMINDECARYDVPISKVALVGFSQGGMLALHVGLRMKPQPACIVSYAGLLLDPTLRDVTPPTPPILLVHGIMDPVVPFMFMDFAERTLRASNIVVETMARPGLGHSIDMQGIAAGGSFMRKCL